MSATGYYPPLEQVNAIVRLGHYLQLNVPQYANQTLRQIAATPSFGSVLGNDTTGLDYFHTAFGSNSTIAQGQAVIASLRQEDTCRGGIYLNGFLDVLSAAMIVLRLVSKRISGSKLKWDDHLIWIAFVFFFCKQPIILYECKKLHTGWHAWDLPFWKFKKTLQFAFWLEIPYYPNLCLVKLSILIFYGTIFRAYRRALQACYVLGVILILGNVMAVIGVFQYVPLDYWNHVLDYEDRFDRLAFFSSIGYITIITDFAMLAMPVCILPKIKAMHVRDKIILLGLFACGTFAGIAGILRLLSLPEWVNSADWGAAASNTGTWSNLEIHMGIVCSCVPHLKPVALLTASGVKSLYAKITNRQNGGRKDSDTSNIIAGLAGNNDLINNNNGNNLNNLAGRRGAVAKCGLEFDEKDMSDFVDPSKQDYNVAVAALPSRDTKPKKKGMFSALMGSLDLSQATTTEVDIEKGEMFSLSKIDTKDESLNLSRVATSATQSVASQSIAGTSRNGSVSNQEEEGWRETVRKMNEGSLDIEAGKKK